ncbi:hypothetical protein [Methanococcoides sp. AM1]|uniref:hypothetical protein n=1 Tax=Methanococcoides sp. AM1 TaxID=1201011 RepID=UPI001083AF60|nr:hypothetical protein [Methanococcoides sp. AM1]
MLKDIENIEYDTKISDVFLANDIIQGEDVPFFILWDGDNPDEIQLEIDGFNSLLEIHNSDINKAIFENNQIIVRDFQVDGYLGGILSTESTNDYYHPGSLKVHFIKDNRIIYSFHERRTIFSTIVNASQVPSVIYIDDDSMLSDEIEIMLQGKTTVFFDIEELEDNHCIVDMPSDVKDEIQNITNIFNEGLIDLKLKFPSHSNTIDLMLELNEEKMSMTKYIEDLDEKLTKAMSDENFADAFITLFMSIFYKQNSLEKLVLKPLNEYFETYSINKAYFSNPLLNVTINKGICQLAIKIHATDLLNQECGDPVEIRTTINSEIDTSISVRDLLSIRRCSND